MWPFKLLRTIFPLWFYISPLNTKSRLGLVKPALMQVTIMMTKGNLLDQWSIKQTSGEMQITFSTRKDKKLPLFFILFFIYLFIIWSSYLLKGQISTHQYHICALSCLNIKACTEWWTRGSKIWSLGKWRRRGQLASPLTGTIWLRCYTFLIAILALQLRMNSTGLIKRQQHSLGKGRHKGRAPDTFITPYFTDWLS